MIDCMDWNGGGYEDDHVYVLILILLSPSSFWGGSLKAHFPTHVASLLSPYREKRNLFCTQRRRKKPLGKMGYGRVDPPLLRC